MNDDLAASREQFGAELAGEGPAVRLWLNGVAGPGWVWYVKRLSANDTLANGAHQAGPYLPRALSSIAFPAVTRRHETELNPDFHIAFSLDSHRVARDIRMVWYNNRVVQPGGTRDEARLTQFGGGSSPILEPESTGLLVVFAFELEAGRDSSLCRAWLCDGDEEASAVEDMTGPIEPGEGLVLSPARGRSDSPILQDRPCWLTEAEMPGSWFRAFPTSSAIVEEAVSRLVTLRDGHTPSDERLIGRRDCEFALFLSVEQLHVGPRIRRGFETVSEFVAFANAVTNRRKARSGASLELHAHAIFQEEGLSHSHGATSEGRKRPDFLFPSAEAYHNPTFPAERLRTLAAKTTCKDRWRQILNEADRIPLRHLLTLQEGVSVNQWNEMRQHDVVLVVPKSLHRKYPRAVRPHLLTLDGFIRETEAVTA